MQFLRDMYQLVTVVYNQTILNETIGRLVDAVREGYAAAIGIELLVIAAVCLLLGLAVDYLLYFFRPDVRFGNVGLIGWIRSKTQKRIL